MPARPVPQSRLADVVSASRRRADFRVASSHCYYMYCIYYSSRVARKSQALCSSLTTSHSSPLLPGFRVVLSLVHSRSRRRRTARVHFHFSHMSDFVKSLLCCGQRFAEAAAQDVRLDASREAAHVGRHSLLTAIHLRRRRRRRRKQWRRREDAAGARVLRAESEPESQSESESRANGSRGACSSCRRPPSVKFQLHLCGARRSDFSFGFSCRCGRESRLERLERERHAEYAVESCRSDWRRPNVGLERVHAGVCRRLPTGQHERRAAGGRYRARTSADAVLWELEQLRAGGSDD